MSFLRSPLTSGTVVTTLLIHIISAVRNKIGSYWEKNMKNGYKVGQRFVKEGKTMQIISTNKDGTATYSQVDNKTGKLMKGFHGTLPAITKETLQVFEMWNVGAATIDLSDSDVKTLDQYQKESEAERMADLKNRWREVDIRLAEKAKAEKEEKIARLDSQDYTKTWKAGGLIQIPAVRKKLHEYETAETEETREEAQKEFLYKLVRLIQLVGHVQEKRNGTKISHPYSEATLNHLKTLKDDLMEGKVGLAEGKDIYPESIFKKGEKVLETPNVNLFINSLNNDLAKSKSSQNAFKKYLDL